MRIHNSLDTVLPQPVNSELSKSQCNVNSNLCNLTKLKAGNTTRQISLTKANMAKDSIPH